MRKLSKTLLNEYGYLFSSKKTKQQTPPKPILKVSRSKLDSNIGGHLIYKTNLHQTFFMSSMIQIAGAAILGSYFYQNPTLINAIPFAMVFAASIYFQKRMFATMKQMIIEKSGQQMKVITYGFLGSQFFANKYIIPIFIMKGVYKKRITKAIVIKGGGQFDFRLFCFYFHKDGVLEKQVFDTIVGGKCVKYVDNL